MFLKAYQTFLDEFRCRKSHIFTFLSNEKISKKSINLQILWNFMNFEEWRLYIIGSDLDVLKSFYRYVIVSLDFPLHTKNVFQAYWALLDGFWGRKSHIFIFLSNDRMSKKSTNLHILWNFKHFEGSVKDDYLTK